MALFDQNGNPINEVMQLRDQGLTDSIIMDELSKKGYSHEQITKALSQADASSVSSSASMPMPPPNGNREMDMGMSAVPPEPRRNGEMGNIYERIEEIAESMIDEKWDDLISEVKKIVDWKQKIEEKQNKMMADLEKLKEDFQTLHQGVLGKLDEYDGRMQDVGTELKAVGKVFKDVVPQFVQNVKDLGRITSGIKEKK